MDWDLWICHHLKCNTLNSSYEKYNFSPVIIHNYSTLYYTMFKFCKPFCSMVSYQIKRSLESLILFLLKDQEESKIHKYKRLLSACSKLNLFEFQKFLPKAVVDNKWAENGRRAGDMWCVFVWDSLHLLFCKLGPPLWFLPNLFLDFCLNFYGFPPERDI